MKNMTFQGFWRTHIIAQAVIEFYHMQIVWRNNKLCSVFVYNNQCHINFIELAQKYICVFVYMYVCVYMYSYTSHYKTFS